MFPRRLASPSPITGPDRAPACQFSRHLVGETGFREGNIVTGARREGGLREIVAIAPYSGNPGSARDRQFIEAFAVEVAAFMRGLVNVRMSPERHA